MRVLVCGDRTWDDWPTMLFFMQHMKNGDVLIEGEAKGADKLSRAAVEALGANVEILPFPADWQQYGKAAGPIRNQKMLDEGKPDLVLAFHRDFANSKGTADMVKRAKAAGIPVYLVDRLDP